MLKLPSDRPIPHTTPASWPSLSPERLAASIQTEDPARAEVALLGLPDDTGVRLNGGRPGAFQGPAAFRQALSRFGTAYDIDRQRRLTLGIYDAGDIIPVSPQSAEPAALEDAMHQTHERVTEALLAIHRGGLFPVCIGGGHDLAWPTVRALSRFLGHSVGGINLDAHLDCRETPGSGMPFRKAIDEGCLDPQRFVIWGAGRFTNSEEILGWLLQRGGSIFTSAAIRQGLFPYGLALQRAMPLPNPVDLAFSNTPSPFAPLPASPAFLSLDLDVFDAAYAPGVSALNPDGFAPLHLLALLEDAARHPGIRAFEIMELNPLHDDGRTARLAALCFLTFLSGLQERFSR